MSASRWPQTASTLPGAWSRRCASRPAPREEVSWPASVSREGTASIKFTARTDGGPEDAVLQELPIYLDVTPETTATGGVVTDEADAGGRLHPLLHDPEGRPRLALRQRAGVARRLAAEAARSTSGRAVWDSVEQRAERVIATLAALDAEPDAELPYSQDVLSNDIAEIVSLQRGDGGWPWCRDCSSSDPQVTALGAAGPRRLAARRQRRRCTAS